MPRSTEPWTVAPWRELVPREGERFEVVEGELVVGGVPERRHAVAVKMLAAPVAAYVDTLRIGEIHWSLAPVFLNDYNVYLPDLVVFPPGGRIESEWEDLGTPLLAVEVLSPSTAKHDRGAKR